MAQPTKRRRAVQFFQPNILATVALLIQAAEGWTFGHAKSLNSLFPSAFADPVVFNETIYLSIALAGTALYLLGGVGIFFHHPLGNFVAWFIFFGMILGEPTHLLVFPLLEGGRYHYFPGMWTALFPLVTGVWGMVVIVTQYNRDKLGTGRVT